MLERLRSRRRAAPRRRSACCAAATSAPRTRSCSTPEALGVLEVDRDALLPAVARHPEAHLEEEAVHRHVVDLDHGRAEVGEQLGTERPGDREAEVEHDDTVKRRSERSSADGRGVRRDVRVPPRPEPRRCARPGARRHGSVGAATFSNPYTWPTMRMPSTSTTLPSRSNSGSLSASSGDRTGWTGMPSCAARRTQSSAGNFATASRIASSYSWRTSIPSGVGKTRPGASLGAVECGPRFERIHRRGVEDRPRHRQPMVGPATVGSLEEPLRVRAGRRPMS